MKTIIAKLGWLTTLVIFGALVFTCSIGLSELQNYLLRTRFLNTLDLPPIGNDVGTLYQYLTNVWYWDGIGLILLLALALDVVALFAVIIAKTISAAKQRLTRTA